MIWVVYEWWIPCYSWWSCVLRWIEVVLDLKIVKDSYNPENDTLEWGYSGQICRDLSTKAVLQENWKYRSGFLGYERLKFFFFYKNDKIRLQAEMFLRFFTSQPLNVLKMFLKLIFVILIYCSLLMLSSNHELKMITLQCMLFTLEWSPYRESQFSYERTHSTTNMSKKQKTLLSFRFTKKNRHNGALVEVTITLMLTLLNVDFFLSFWSIHFCDSGSLGWAMFLCCS